MAIDTEERTSKPAKGSSKNQTNNKKLVRIIIAVVGVLLLLGILCAVVSGFLLKKGAEKIISDATGSDVTINTKKGQEGVNIKSKDGDNLNVNAGDDVKLPKDYPSNDVPLYKGSKLISAVDMKVGDAKSFTLILETKDSIEKVINFYEKELSDNGWEKVSSTNTGSYSVVYFHNKTKKIGAEINISNDEDINQISMSIRTG